MTALEGKNVFQKIWYFLRTYILVLKIFDIYLQGTFLVVILLNANAMLLLRRDSGTGRLASLLEDWVVMGVAVVEFLIGSTLAWFGGKRRTLAMSGCLSATALFSLLVLAFPYQEKVPPSVVLCSGEPISVYSDAHSNITDDETDGMAPYRIVLLIITVTMCSLTTISIWSHGLTYLDDHYPQNGPYFYGILISIRLSLGLSGQNWLRPGALRNDWWEAHLSLSMLVLMFAINFLLFPKQMSNYTQVDATNNTGFFASLSRILHNKALSLQILALSLLNAGLFGFISLDSAYVQARFHIEAVWNDPRTSRVVSDLFRALVVIFFVMIFRVRFSNRREDGVKANTAARVGGVVAIIVAILFSVIAFLNCSTGDIAGMEGGRDWQQPQCSWECRCNPGQYGFTPVCVVDTGITHFSPCSTGCNEYESLNGPIALFHNCTCGVDQRVVRGSCTLPSCQAAFAAYQVLYTVTIAVSGAAMLMQGMVVLRAVQRWDKPIAQGLAFSTITLLANIPGRLLFLSISYLTCVYQGDNGATCSFHRPTLFWAPVTSSVLALCSAIISLFSSKLNRDLGRTSSFGSGVILNTRN